MSQYLSCFVFSFEYCIIDHVSVFRCNTWSYNILFLYLIFPLFYIIYIVYLFTPFSFPCSYISIIRSACNNKNGTITAVAVYVEIQKSFYYSLYFFNFTSFIFIVFPSITFFFPCSFNSVIRGTRNSNSSGSKTETEDNAARTKLLL